MKIGIIPTIIERNRSLNYLIDKSLLLFLNKVFDKLNVSDTEFVDKLVAWADIIRKTYVEGAIDELITTRRLVHISNAYAIFNMDRMKAIQMCVNRFDGETMTAMVDLYTKVDAEAVNAETNTETKVEGEEECPF